MRRVPKCNDVPGSEATRDHQVECVKKWRRTKVLRFVNNKGVEARSHGVAVEERLDSKVRQYLFEEVMLPILRNVDLGNGQKRRVNRPRVDVTERCQLFLKPIPQQTVVANHSNSPTEKRGPARRLDGEEGLPRPRAADEHDRGAPLPLALRQPEPRPVKEGCRLVILILVTTVESTVICVQL